MPAPAPSAALPKYRQVLSALESDIASGRYRPGQKLPTEAQLGKQFGTSRITIARAFLELQQKGLVRRRVGSGTYVLPAPSRANQGLLFGALIPNVGQTEIFGPICQGILEALQHRRHALLWGYTAPGAEAHATHSLELCQQYIERQVAGVFFAPVEWTAENDRANLQMVAALTQAGIPVVLLDRDLVPFPERSPYDLVGIDNRRVGYRLTQHLLQAGCRRIAFVTYAKSAPTVAMRLAGYREALQAVDAPFEAAFVQQLETSQAREVDALMERGKPEGIVCANDWTAGNVMHRLLSLGYRIPQEVRIVGVDDVGYASLLPVPLTTMRQPCRAMGATAVTAMLERIATPELPVRDILLESSLVVRQSCGTRSASGEAENGLAGNNSSPAGPHGSTAG
jgi:GntR family transcriptional regulator, arabinose operon transcriptional repressor